MGIFHKWAKRLSGAAPVNPFTALGLAGVEMVSSNTVLHAEDTRTIYILEGTGEIGYSFENSFSSVPGVATLISMRRFAEETARDGQLLTRATVNTSDGERLSGVALAQLGAFLHGQLRGTRFAGQGRFIAEEVHAIEWAGASLRLANTEVTDYGRVPVTGYPQRLPAMRLRGGLCIRHPLHGIWYYVRFNDTALHEAIAGKFLMSRFAEFADFPRETPSIASISADRELAGTLLLTDAYEGALVRISETHIGFHAELVLPGIDLHHLGVCVGDTTADGGAAAFIRVRGGSRDRETRVTLHPPERAAYALSRAVHKALGRRVVG